MIGWIVPVANLVSGHYTISDFGSYFIAEPYYLLFK